MRCHYVVDIPCAYCEELVEFQSKAIECEVDTYTYLDIPLAIAKVLNGESGRCRWCGARLSAYMDAETSPISMFTIVD
jgi:hypothetical protein